MSKDTADGEPAIPNLKPQISNLEFQAPDHQIYTGAFAALEARWIEVVSDLQRNDPLDEVNVLVGSNILASYLKRRLAESGRTAANIRFYTFLDLAARLAGNPAPAVSAPASYAPAGPAAAAPAAAGPRLPRLGATMLLESILASRVPSAYAALAGYKGFREALLETFRDLRDAGISPDAMDSFLAASRTAEDRGRHLQGFATLYRQFREQVSRFHEDDDDFRAAIRQVAASDFMPGSRPLLIYGIYDATGQQSRLLAALKKSRQMIYFIPFVDSAVSEFARPFLEARAEELGVRPCPLSSSPNSGSLGKLNACDFGFSRESVPAPALPADGSFSLISAPGESRAAVEIVREILRAVHDGTIAGFHEAAVVFRQPENDVPILAEALRLRGVPYFIHGGSRFAERPVSRAVLALSGLQATAFSREAVLTAMEFVEAALPASSAEAWEVQNWRALTNDARFLAGVRSWDSGTLAVLEQVRSELSRSLAQPDGGEDGDYPMPAAEAARKRRESAQRLRDAWLQIRFAAADWPESLSWKDWAHFLEQHLGPLLETSPDWPRFLTALDEIANLQVMDLPGKRDSGSENGCSAEKLRSALEEAVASFSYPAGRFQRSGVNLLSASAARGLRFSLVLIPGLDEGRFPSKLRQDPLLPDSVRLRMNDLPLKSKRIEEEKLLFDMAARSADKRLILMTSRLDESSDRERIPSQFFLRAAAAVRGATVSMRDLIAGNIPGFRSVTLDDPAPAPGAEAVDEGEIRLRLITAEKELGRQALEALVRLEPQRLKRILDYDQARWKNVLTEFDGKISNPVLTAWIVQKLGASSRQVSASRIEEYAKCPYYFFLKRIHGLEAWEEPGKAEAMDPLERGTVMHSILETFIKDSVGESFAAIPDGKLESLLTRQSRNELEKARPAGMPDLLWEIERDTLIGVLQKWLEFESTRSDGSLRIARLEQSFGNFFGEEENPSFKLSAGKHLFDFRGRIDRVDISRDGKHARVTDYKTGRMPDSLGRKVRPLLMGGERIQLAVYRGALSVLSGFEGLESVEAEYLYLQPRDGRIRLSAYAQEELEASSKALPYVLEILGDGMGSGIFFPRTAGTVYPAGHCDYCDFLMICGKDRMKKESRKSVDPAVVRFSGILEPPR